jgi:hypothetical protein
MTPAPSGASRIDQPRPARCLGRMARSSARRRPRLLFINAALGGDTGNTAQALASLRRRCATRAVVRTLVLATQPEATLTDWRAELTAADALVFATGTHWDGWSSHLQRFLETTTPAECSPLWLGKPAAVIVTEHSVGGKAVLSRLQGVLLTLGCALPPLSGLVLSHAALLAARHAPQAARDFWCVADLGVVAHNLLTALGAARGWRTWPVARRDLSARWWLGG